MPIQHAIGQVSNQPTLLASNKLVSEQQLEEMIVREPRILSSAWMLIELKRDRTPHEIVVQALGYASWVAKLTANLRYVATSPPAERPLQRRREYFDLACAVVDALPVFNKKMLKAFRAAFEARPRGGYCGCCRVRSASTFISTLARASARHSLGGICMMRSGVPALAM